MILNIIKKTGLVNLITKIFNKNYIFKLLFFNIYKKRLSKFKNNRYSNIFIIIKKNKCRTFLEIGTYDGNNAFKMIKTAQKNWPKDQIEYYGFDLFEDFMMIDKDKEFFQEKNLMFSSKYIQNFLSKMGANIFLYKGYTKDTLPLFLREIKNKKKIFDLIFIDGGHSIETIENDWNYVKKLMDNNTIVLFDDYYITKEKENIAGVGCNSIIHGLNQNKYEITFLKPADTFKKDWGNLKIYIVKVVLK